MYGNENGCWDESLETKSNFAGHTHLRAKMKRSQWKRKTEHNQVSRGTGNKISFWESWERDSKHHMVQRDRISTEEKHLLLLLKTHLMVFEHSGS